MTIVAPAGSVAEIGGEAGVASLPRARFRLPWPGSLQGQVLLALAGALLLAQAISAVLIYRAQAARREEGLAHMVAMRLYNAGHRPGERAGSPWDHAPPAFDHPASASSKDLPGSTGGRGIEIVTQFAPIAQDRRLPDVEQILRQVFQDQAINLAGVIVVERPFAADPDAQARLAQREAMFAHHPQPPSHLLIAAIRLEPNGLWRVARVFAPPDEGDFLTTLLIQTVVIYALLVGATAFILRRITRPLAALTTRLEHFAETRDPDGRLEPRGPDDLRRLILAHNAMEARIISLLDEKDVMLGAIGHDLKTPLSALRVRIESVEDDVERGRMAATIEDIVRTLDDILSLARVGRPSDPCEATELSALVGSVVEEYEDMGDPVTVTDMPRIVVPLRATWLRRALRNLIGNALRYGHQAEVSLARESARDGSRQEWAVIRIDDHGPGIADADIARMLEPFTRGDPSRNSETGGAGLGLTLALAIAEQHGGRLHLANRKVANGRKGGLRATLRLPIG
jgi:signal transduction histidine kinase